MMRPLQRHDSYSEAELQRVLREYFEREARERYSYATIDNPSPSSWIADDIPWEEDRQPHSEWCGKFVDIRRPNKNRDIFPGWNISFSNGNGIYVNHPEDMEMSENDIEELMEMI